MSPEQARGKPVDRRTDIWAFGCVLYEWLAGRRPFEGEALTDLLAAIVGDEADLSRLPRLPAHVRELLWRCLTKDPRARLRDIGEARVWLEGTAGAGSRRIVALACVVGLIAAALWAGHFLAAPTPDATTATRFTCGDRLADRGNRGGNLLAVAVSRRGREARRRCGWMG